MILIKTTIINNYNIGMDKKFLMIFKNILIIKLII